MLIQTKGENHRNSSRDIIYNYYCEILVQKINKWVSNNLTSNGQNFIDLNSQLTNW